MENHQIIEISKSGPANRQMAVFNKDFLKAASGLQWQTLLVSLSVDGKFRLSTPALTDTVGVKLLTQQHCSLIISEELVKFKA